MGLLLKGAAPFFVNGKGEQVGKGGGKVGSSETCKSSKDHSRPETMDDRVRRLLYLGLTRASARIELVVSAQAMAALNAAAG